MFDIFLGVFLLLSPIFVLPPIGNLNALQFYQWGVIGNAGYNYLQLQFFCFGTIGLFITALLSKPQREFKDKWVVVLLSLFCVNVYFHPIGIKMLAPILLGFLLYYLVVVYTKDFRKLFKFIFLASLLNTIFALLQLFNIHLIYRPTGRIDGLMCLSIHLGTYQALALPICYALNPWLAVVPLIGLLLSKSMTAIAVGFVWGLIAFRKRLLSLGPVYWLCIFTVVGVVILKNLSLIHNKIDIRLEIWIPTIKDIYHHLFGIGLKPVSLNSTYGLFENTCSVYLALVRWLGVLVLIPILMLIKQVLKAKDFFLVSSIGIALVIGLEKSILDFPRLAGTIIVLYGFLTIAKGVKLEN